MFLKKRLLNYRVSVPMHIILLFSLCCSISLFGDAKSELDKLTGGIHSRVAWREGGEPIKGGGNAIKGFDSKTGKIHTIWDDKCVKSVICAGGHKVLVTSGDYKVWVVDWDGSNKKLLATGSVSDGWRDPATGKDWAVYRASGTGTGGGVYRVLIDDPDQKVKIYGGDEGHSVYPWFQMSADGKMGVSFFPWSKGGVLDISSGKVSNVTKGCWSGLASDNSYNWLHLAGSHKDLISFNGTKKIATFNAMPPISGGQIYCPRTAEGPEKGGLYITLCGGYPGYNKNGNGVEVFVGKMKDDYSGVSGWARITNNKIPDQHPNVWIGVEPKTDIKSDMNKMSSSSFSMKMTGARTLNVQISQRESYGLEITKSNGIMMKKVSVKGPEHLSWKAPAPGVYLVRIIGKDSEVSKRFVIK